MDSMVVLRAQITGAIVNDEVNKIDSYFNGLDINNTTLRNYLYNVQNKNLMIDDIILLFFNDSKITTDTTKRALRIIQKRIDLGNVNLDSLIDGIGEYRDAAAVQNYPLMEETLKKICDIDVSPAYKRVFINLYIEVLLSDKVRVRERLKDVEKYTIMLRGV